MVSECLKKVIHEHSRIDILINNAGIGNEKNVDAIIDINFVSYRKFNRFVLKSMDNRGIYRNSS